MSDQPIAWCSFAFMLTNRMLARLEYRTYDYFDIKSKVQVQWRSHPRSCLYHATLDGREALCGVKGLVETNPYPSCEDPGNDLMTCLHCQEMVRRVRSQP